MLPNDPYRGAPPRQAPVIHQAYDDHAAQAMLKRGRYDANAYVFFGAVIQALFVGGLFALPVRLALDAADVGSSASTLSWVILVVVGVPAAVVTYWGRWARVEAYSSRFCSGIANLSMLYVPLVAFVFANVVLTQDLLRRKR